MAFAKAAVAGGIIAVCSGLADVPVDEGDVFACARVRRIGHHGRFA
jgi:hypothetical protein